MFLGIGFRVKIPGYTVEIIQGGQCTCLNVGTADLGGSQWYAHTLWRNSRPRFADLCPEDV